MVERILEKQGVEDIVVGAAVLGAGGGGPPYLGRILGLQAFEEGKIRLLNLVDLPDDSTVVVSAGMGSPAAHLEKWVDVQLIKAFEALRKYLGREVHAVAPIETGGGNIPTAMYVAAKENVPLVDGDGAGRAVPELQMVMYYIHKIPVSPMAVADSLGNVAILEVVDAYAAERIARAVTVEYGYVAGLAAFPMTGKQLKESVIPNTITFAEKIGRALRESKTLGRDLIKAVLVVTNGVELIRGRITNVAGKTIKGFDFGTTEIEGEGTYLGIALRVDFKNENMIAWKDGEPVAMVPDLICMINMENGQPLTNVDVRPGLRVSVIGISAHEKWRTKEGSGLFRRELELLEYRGEYVQPMHTRGRKSRSNLNSNYFLEKKNS